MTLEVSDGTTVDLLSTVVRQVRPAMLAVATPRRGPELRQLPEGAAVHAWYFDRGRRLRFATQVTGYDQRRGWQLLAPPARIDSSERRRSYRLATMLHQLTVYRLVVDAERNEREGDTLRCTVVDLSEGGLCLSTRSRTVNGEWLGLVAVLPQGPEIRARLRVVGVDHPAPGGTNHRVHCSFVNLSRTERDAIAKFLMRRQLEMRREGRL